MAKAAKRNGDEPESDEAVATTETAGEIPSQLVPYPTGNPPDPMEEYYKAHPERVPPEEPAPEAAAKTKAKAPSSEDDFDEPFKKGKK